MQRNFQQIQQHHTPYLIAITNGSRDSLFLSTIQRYGKDPRVYFPPGLSRWSHFTRPPRRVPAISPYRNEGARSVR